MATVGAPARRSGHSRRAPGRPSLEQLFADASDNLIGVWRFRERGQPRRWCATFVVDGYYYDTTGKRTVHAALGAVLREINRVKQRGRET